MVCNKCGALGIFRSKIGKWWCTPTVSKCPAKRDADSIRKRGKVPPPHVLKAANAARKGHPAWNSNKTAATDSRLNLKAQKLKARYASGELVHVAISHTEQTKRKLSEIAKARGLGGYVEGSGRGKSGWYKGYYCDSSWELAFVIWCLDHNKSIQRNRIRYPYKYKGVMRNYIPDFIVDGRLTEIKGYMTEIVEIKLSSVGEIDLYDQKRMQPILNYAIAIYGKNFIRLYEMADSEGVEPTRPF